MTNVAEALTNRRSVRAFQSRAVQRETVEALLALAARAPSGGNLQPWRVDAVAGDALAALKADVRASLMDNPAGEGLEFEVYPAPLPDPYRARRSDVGAALYAALGIARDDKPARLRQFARNYEGFGAPVLLFLSLDRIFDRPQWAHLGMFMQSLMLLAAERGLATCPQEAWAAAHRTVGRILALPAERILYCGIALGYAEEGHPANALVTERAPVADFATFHGF